MERTRWLLVACCLVSSPLAIAATVGGTNSPRPPNVVLLFSDDAGWADFGFQPDCAADASALTPRIDSLAHDGARFQAAYASGAVCSPSRAGLLTGRYQQRFGHETNIPPGYRKGGLDLEEPLVGDRLRPLGYRTGIVGKWHLGYPDEYHPNRRGFDWFHGLLQGSRSYFPIDAPSPHRVIQENGEPLPEVGHVTDRFGAAAARFIRDHADRPFFLFVSFTATHGPLQPTESDLGSLPNSIEEKRRKNLGLLVGLDRAVGAVLDALDDQGLREETMVVFTNDNGGQTLTGASNRPLRGRKGDLYEGGIRVPTAIRWPARIEANTVIEDPVTLLDLVPTFVSAAGGVTEPQWAIDGLDLVPHLTGERSPLPDRALFWRTKGSSGPVAIRRGAWKLVWRRGEEGAKPELYDLAHDIAESTDLALEHPDRVAELLQELASWESQLTEPRWGPGSSDSR